MNTPRKYRAFWLWRKTFPFLDYWSQPLVVPIYWFITLNNTSARREGIYLMPIEDFHELSDHQIREEIKANNKIAPAFLKNGVIEFVGGYPRPKK